MAFDAFVYFPGNENLVGGETQDQKMSEKQAFEIHDFELGAENIINIGSATGGGGAGGKATFKPFSFSKRTDTSSCGLFLACCEGRAFEECVVEMRRSGAAGGATGATFLKFEMKLVMVENISWTGRTDDDSSDENVVLQCGAYRITYFSQGADGSVSQNSQSMFSRVLNVADYAV